MSAPAELFPDYPDGDFDPDGDLFPDYPEEPQGGPRSPAALSLGGAEALREDHEAVRAGRLVDDVIARGTVAGVAVSEEVRRQVRQAVAEAVKKNTFPRPS
jgi:hypothetical protein